MENWQRLVIEYLQDIANVDAQRASWVENRDMSMLDPIELCCGLFDDTSLDEQLSRGPVFSRECDELLRHLSKLVDDIDLDRDAAAVLDSPEWREIAATAQATLDCLNAT